MKHNLSWLFAFIVVSVSNPLPNLVVCPILSTNAYQRADDVKIFPNPVSTELNFESSGLVRQIEIYDITGRLNFSVQINGLKGTINTVSLKSGMYLLKVISSEKSQTFKLEKK